MLNAIFDAIVDLPTPPFPDDITIIFFMFFSYFLFTIVRHIFYIFIDIILDFLEDFESLSLFICVH